jgi:hypothetical protein
MKRSKRGHASGLSSTSSLFTDFDFAMEAHRFQSALKDYPEHARILGLIADTCNLIEKVLCEAVAAALSLSDAQTEAFYYSLQASRSRFDVASGVLSRFVQPDASRDQYLAQIDIAKRLFSRRSAMVHNIWDSRRAIAGILDFSESPGSRSRWRPISIKEMEKLLTELENCLNGIIEISIFVSAWQPSRDTLQSPP